MPNPDQASEQLSQLTKKRLALESLINITTSIQAQQESLSELSVISKPSQAFPKKLIAQVEILSQRIGDLPIPELIQRLNSIEAIMAKSVNHLLLLAKIDVNELRDEKVGSLSVDEFVDAISRFKSRTQSAVALRFLLKNRGVAISPFSLEIPQEAITEHIVDLKTKEKGCIKQIRKEIVSIIKDSVTMLKSEQFNDEIKVGIENVKQAMEVNLAYLDKGGKVSGIPNVFETIVLESEVSEAVTIEEPTELAVEGKQAKESSMEEKIQAQAESFWSLFQRWLSTPWKSSWKSLKKKPLKSKSPP
jgi:hypothetical protein